MPVIAASPSAAESEGTKHDFGHFRLDKRAHGFDRIAKYDFLLVFYRDRRFRWSRLSSYKPLVSKPRRNPQGEETEQEEQQLREVSNKPLWLRDTAKMTKTQAISTRVS